jgi:hypothetical protein
MKTAHGYVEYAQSKLHRAIDTLRALRADAELAGRASAIAQLSRRSESALRQLYVAPRAMPDKARSVQAPASASTGPRLQWIGQLGATAVAVCLLLVVVIVMVVPHAA